MLSIVRVSLLLSSITIFSLITGEAQDSTILRVQELKEKIELEDNPRKKVAYYLKLVSVYKYVHPDVDNILENALRIAEENDLPFYIARSLMKRSRYRIYKDALEADFIADVERIKEISLTLDNHLLPIWYNNLYGAYYLKKDSLSLSERYFDNTQLLVDSLLGGRHWSLYTYKGMLYQKQRRYKEALSAYQEALQQEEHGDVYINNNLAKLYIEMGQWTKAETAISVAMKSSLIGMDVIPIIESLLIGGRIKLHYGDTLGAINYFLKGDSLRNLEFYGKIYSTRSELVELYMHQGQWEEVEPLLLDIEQYRDTDDYIALRIQRGQLYNHKGHSKKGLAECQEAQTLALSSKNLSHQLKSCKCLIECNRSLGRLDQTIYWMEQMMVIEDAINAEDKIRELASTIANYEVREDMNKLHADNILKEERIRQQRNVLITSILALSALLFMLYALFKQKKKIQSQKEIVSIALDEKETLLREIHHRVKNNLQVVSSLLRIQSNHTTDEVAIDALKDGQSRVQSMSLIHQDLYQRDNLTGIRMKVYLERLLNNLFNTYNISPQQIKLSTDISELNLDVDTVVPLGLLINELITNSLKYAFPNHREGNLYLSLQEENELLVLKVEDNGVGISDPEDIIEGDSFGYSLIQAFVSKLDGEMKITTDTGTCLEFVFKEYKKV